MAYIVADTAFDITDLNLSFFGSNIVATQTRLAENVTFDTSDFISGGQVITYPDAFYSRSRTTNPAVDLRIELLGTGFNQTAGGIPSTGTVNYFGVADPVSGFGNWWVWGFSVPISSFLTAMTTNDPADDTSLLLSLLSGNDLVLLSNSDDAVATEAGDDLIFGYDGNDILFGGSGTDDIWGDAGSDSIQGESGVDTAGYAGNRSAYTITQGSTGVFTVTGPDGTDTLRTTEYARFDDQTVRLYPGTGTTVNFANDNPATYMAAIRDFDGNNLGSASGWKLIGQADANGDGDADRFFVNPANGRFAEVATAPDGKVYFSDHGWAGETRVVGIYVDPLVQSGQVVAGGPNDSQRRFQNDLSIDNISRVLGANDYDRDGLQEVYFALTDGTAYLHAYMHADGNIRYANYQSQQQVIDFLDQNNWADSTYAGWFA